MDDWKDRLKTEKSFQTEALFSHLLPQFLSKAGLQA